jgi:type II secretory pathway component PulC
MLRSIGAFGLRWVKRPWILVAVCVLVCSALAAKAVGHVIEAQVLSDSRTAPRVPQVEAPASAPAAPRVDRGAQGSSLVTRDMFCSTCAPPPPPGPGVVDPAGGIPLTSLPLVLIATSLGHQPIATVRDDRSGSQGAFEVGESLPGSGEITKIGATYVDFVNAASSREERISLLALASSQPPPPPPPGAPPADAPYADRVKKIDDTRYEVDRSLVKELVAAAGKPVPGVRMIPVSKDGKLAGIRVLSARPDSIAGVLGLKGSDTLNAVNGVPIDSLDKMLELYSKMDDMNVVTIDGTRGGKPISWQYTMR